MAIRQFSRMRLLPFDPLHWWRRHLMVRLSGYSLLLSVLSVGAIGSVTFYRAQVLLQQSAFEELNAIASLKKNEIHRWLEDQQRMFLAIAQAPVMQQQGAQQLQAVIDNVEAPEARALLTEYLDSKIKTHPNFTEVSILDSGDRVILSTDKTQVGQYRSSADLTYFDRVLPGQPATPIFYRCPKTGQLMVTFASPITNAKGQRLGVVVAHLSVRELSRILALQSGIQQAVEVYLVSSVGASQTLVSEVASTAVRVEFANAALVSPKPSSTPLPKAQPSDGLESPSTQLAQAGGIQASSVGQTIASYGIDAAMAGRDGSGLYANYAQVPVMGIYQSMGHLGLALLVEKRQNVADVPAQQLAQQIVMVGLAAAGLLTLCLYELSRRMIRPILAIANTATEVAAGNLQQTAPVLSQDEVAVLAQNFNYMVQQLNLSQEKSALYSRSLEQKAQELQTTLHELRSTQAQLVHSEKMSSLGQLVAGVAHEINNPVSFIHGNLDYLSEYTHDLVSVVKLYRQSGVVVPEVVALEEALDVEFLITDLNKILRSMKIGTDRIREIVLSLRTFSRLDEAEFKPVDIHEGLEGTLLLLQHRLKKQLHRPEIQLVKQYGELPLVECYAGQLNQVFMNILANAIDALEARAVPSSARRDDHPVAVAPGAPSAAQARSQSEGQSPQIDQITIQTAVEEEGWMQVTITDNGPGMSEATQKQLFNPFFTTKPVGKGTGMGLAISTQIVDKHGGLLTCRSTVGMGTEFTIKLPIQQPGKV
jgi:two-component system, NtrC family, sensor kinase